MAGAGRLAAAVVVARGRPFDESFFFCVNELARRRLRWKGHAHDDATNRTRRTRHSAPCARVYTWSWRVEGGVCGYNARVLGAGIKSESEIRAANSLFRGRSKIKHARALWFFGWPGLAHPHTKGTQQHTKEVAQKVPPLVAVAVGLASFVCSGQLSNPLLLRSVHCTQARRTKAKDMRPARNVLFAFVVVVFSFCVLPRARTMPTTPVPFCYHLLSASPRHPSELIDWARSPQAVVDEMHQLNGNALVYASAGCEE